MSDYPRVRFQWSPKDGSQEISSKLWGCIMCSGQARVRALRKQRKEFRIVEHKPNAYIIES